MQAREFLKLKNIKPIYRLIDGKETGEFIVTPELMVEYARLVMQQPNPKLVTKCPFCGAKIKPVNVTHYQCKSCKLHFTD